MKEDILKELVERTFAKLSCPAMGYGMYAEIERVLSEAYRLGKEQREYHNVSNKREELLYSLFNDAE